MLVLDALFDPIQQISSNVEITGSLVQFAQLWQLAAGAGDASYSRAPLFAENARPYLPFLAMGRSTSA